MGTPEEIEAPSGEAAGLLLPTLPGPHWAALSWPRLGLRAPLPSLDPSFLSPACPCQPAPVTLPEIAMGASGWQVALGRVLTGPP